jgi:DNA-binding response OmpR family regulator
MADFEILLWDDGAPIFQTLSWVLDYKGYKAAAVSIPEAAIEALATKNYDLLIAKLPLAPDHGLKVIKRAKKLNPEIRVIVVGNEGQVAFPLEAYRLRIDDYILMPCTAPELWRRVAACLGSLEKKRPESDSQLRLAEINERVLKKLAQVFHDIRNSMVSTSAALKLLLRGAHGEMDRGVSQKLRDADARVRKIIGVSEEYMTSVLSARRGVSLDSEPLDLRDEIVTPVLEELSGELRDHRITIDNRLSLRPPAVAIPVKGSKLYL